MNEAGAKLMELLSAGDFCEASKYALEHLWELPEYMREGLYKLGCELREMKRAN